MIEIWWTCITLDEYQIWYIPKSYKEIFQDKFIGLASLIWSSLFSSSLKILNAYVELNITFPVFHLVKHSRQPTKKKISFKEVRSLISQVHEIFYSLSNSMLAYIVIGIIIKGNVYNHINFNLNPEY